MNGESCDHTLHGVTGDSLLYVLIPSSFCPRMDEYVEFLPDGIGGIVRERNGVSFAMTI